MRSDSFPVYITKPRRGVKAKSWSVRRKQFPLVPAYAITDIKSQGSTLPAVIVDLQTPADGHSSFAAKYVALSRARSLQSIAILRPFSRQDLEYQPPRDLLAEERRLASIAVKTASKYKR